MSETPGERLFDIRAACGGGPRAPMSMKEFVALVKERTGVTYHANTISLLEQNKQVWRLSDVRALAAVDPLNRGEVWLSTLTGAWLSPTLAEDVLRNSKLKTPYRGGDQPIDDVPPLKAVRKSTDGRKRRGAK